MFNQIYRLDMTDDFKGEFQLVPTNEVEPHRNIYELGLCIYNKEGEQIDGSFDIPDIDSFIDYLDSIAKFNKNSKPDDMEEK